MERNQNNPDRNRPADKGRNNDPFVRDDSGQQPGVNTMSDSKNKDDYNERISKTASDNFNEKSFGENADPSFDEIDEQDKNEK